MVSPPCPHPHVSSPTSPACPPSACPHSSLNSVNSSDSRSSGSHSHSPSSHYRYRSSNLAQQAPVRLSSVSSHDSGFISQDAFQSKSPSPMPPDAPNQVRVPLAPEAAVTSSAWATVSGRNQRRTLARTDPCPLPTRILWYNFSSSDVLFPQRVRTLKLGVQPVSMVVMATAPRWFGESSHVSRRTLRSRAALWHPCKHPAGHSASCTTLVQMVAPLPPSLLHPKWWRV